MISLRSVPILAISVAALGVIAWAMALSAGSTRLYSDGLGPHGPATVIAQR
jgi:hypothetical protein